MKESENKKENGIVFILVTYLGRKLSANGWDTFCPKKRMFFPCKLCKLCGGDGLVMLIKVGMVLA